MKKLIVHSFLAAAALATLAGADVATAATAQAGDYEVDIAHTNIGFGVKHLGFSVVIGRFNSFRGDISFNPAGESSVNVEIDGASVDTNSQRRDDHLRSADFFEVTRFPKITYVSQSVEYDQNGDPNKVLGTLTMHGVSLPVPLEVKFIGAGEDPFGDVRTGYQAKATIKRSDFGMTNLIPVAGDEVEITINIEAIKK